MKYCVVFTVIQVIWVKKRLDFIVYWSIDNMETKKLPYRVTVKLDRYQGDVYIFNGGLGGGVTLDADVAKNIITIGLYPLNFSIKHFLDFNFGVGLNARVAYYIPMQKGWSLVPQYQIYAGFSNEFKDIESETRSIRHYLAIGLAKRLHGKRAVSG